MQLVSLRVRLIMVRPNDTFYRVLRTVGGAAERYFRVHGGKMLRPNKYGYLLSRDENHNVYPFYTRADSHFKTTFRTLDYTTCIYNI